MEAKVFSIAEENMPLPGMTISGQLIHDVTCFSLGGGTDISAESYPVPVLIYVLCGTIELFNKDSGSKVTVAAGALSLKKKNANIGIIAKEDSVYLEIPLRKTNY